MMSRVKLKVRLFSWVFFKARGACLGLGADVASPTPRGSVMQGGAVTDPLMVGIIEWLLFSEHVSEPGSRRSRYSIWPLKFEFECLPTQNNTFRGTGTARHLGPTPRGWLKFGRMLACRTRTARNRRVKVDARRSVTGPLSAASARYLRIGDSGFGAVKARFLEMAT